MTELNRQDVEILADEPAYQGFFSLRKLTLRHRLFDGGWSQSLSRELFQRDDAVGVLLYDPVLDVVALVEQFRVGVFGSDIARQKQHSPWLLELVAGLIDKQEQPQQVAAREAVEEAGVTVTALEPIAEYYTSPGGSNEYFYLFAGRADLSRAGGVFGLEQEGEDIRVALLNVNELWQKLERGEFNNAHTLIAVQWLKINHLHLKLQWSSVPTPK